MTSLWIEREYVVVTCGADGCDQEFAMKRRYYDETHRTGAGWYCPRGHRRVWIGPTTEQALEAAKARERHLEDQLRATAEEAERVRGELIRDRHRFANGVCPCCNRSFENVARHMRAQHPDYDVSQVAEAMTSFKCSCGRSFESWRGLRIHQGWARTDDWDRPNAPNWRAHLTVV